MPPKKKTTKKKKSKAAEEEEDVEAPKPKKKEKPKTARDALDMYDNTVDTLGSTKRKYNKDMSDSELGCCGKLLRYLVLVINFFFIVIGFVLLVYGAWYANTSSSASDLTGRGWTKFVIAIGIFIMVVGITGLVGAKYQNRVVLVFYFVIIIILFILTLACGAWVFSLEGKEDSLVQSGWAAAGATVQNTIEGTYCCCGLQDNSPNSTITFPCPVGLCPGSSLSVGCQPILVGEVTKYYSSFGALLLIVCVTLLGDVGITFWLFKALNRLKARSGTTTTN